MMIRILYLSTTICLSSAFSWMHQQPPLRSSRRTQPLASTPPSYGLYEVQEELITKRGQLERQLMSPENGTPLQANVVKGAGSAGGFGSKNNNQATQWTAQGKEHAKVLQQDGIVRIDKVLSPKLADQLLDWVTDWRTQATAQVESGAVPHKERFADVLLRKHRCDLTMPIDEKIPAKGLHQVLSKSPVGATFEALFGPEAMLYEFSCLISDPGSDRQVLHPDTPVLEQRGASLYTCFVALQDVELNMGPTVWMPGTHISSKHAQFQDESSFGEGEDSPKDALCRTQPYVLGLLPKGSCAIFDSRVLHAGTANESDRSRALFYCSFKAPDVGYPGNPASIRPDLAGRYRLKELQETLR